MKSAPVIIVQLIHIQGTAPVDGKIQEFSKETVSIGRDPNECDLLFPKDLTILSRKHAEIVREGNRFKLIDHSTNGTFVNGKSVEEIYLKEGDVLELSEGGPKISFLTQIKEGTSQQVDTAPATSPRDFIVEPPISPDLKPSLPGPDQSRNNIQEPLSTQKTAAPLIIQYGPTLRSYTELPVTIGKGTACDFILDHASIYDQHARFFFRKNQYWIEDITGQNIIQVNRLSVGQAPLNINDDILLSPEGPHFRFLGEGRLAEVAESPVEEVPPFHEEKVEQKDTANRNTSKNILLKLKKYWTSK